MSCLSSSGDFPGVNSGTRIESAATGCVVRELALRDFSVLVQVVNLLINQKVDLASYAGSVCEGDHHLFLIMLCDRERGSGRFRDNGVGANEGLPQ